MAEKPHFCRTLVIEVFEFQAVGFKRLLCSGISQNLSTRKVILGLKVSTRSGLEVIMSDGIVDGG